MEAFSGRGESFLLHVCTALITRGFRCNENEISVPVISTGLDMKIMALKEHATEKQFASEKNDLFLFT